MFFQAIDNGHARVYSVNDATGGAVTTHEDMAQGFTFEQAKRAAIRKFKHATRILRGTPKAAYIVIDAATGQTVFTVTA